MRERGREKNILIKKYGQALRVVAAIDRSYPNQTVN